MDAVAKPQLSSGVCELGREALTLVSGGMIDLYEGANPKARVPGRLTPDADEAHHIAGHGGFLQQGF
jgi:hypothetical protein